MKESDFRLFNRVTRLTHVNNMNYKLHKTIHPDSS